MGKEPAKILLLEDNKAVMDLIARGTPTLAGRLIVSAGSLLDGVELVELLSEGQGVLTPPLPPPIVFGLFI